MPIVHTWRRYVQIGCYTHCYFPFSHYSKLLRCVLVEDHLSRPTSVLARGDHTAGGRETFTRALLLEDIGDARTRPQGAVLLPVRRGTGQLCGSPHTNDTRLPTPHCLLFLIEREREERNFKADASVNPQLVVSGASGWHSVWGRERRTFISGGERGEGVHRNASPSALLGAFRQWKTHVSAEHREGLRSLLSASSQRGLLVLSPLCFRPHIPRSSVLRTRSFRSLLQNCSPPSIHPSTVYHEREVKPRAHRYPR